MQYNPCELLEPVTVLAQEAGHKILEIYGTEFSIVQKQDRSPLTAADTAAHKTIHAGLARLTPGIPVLSEESGEVPFSERVRWGLYWLVDPLDGTREFIKRNGEFTVNIALIEGHQPILGVVYVPVTGATYLACRGGGAYKRMPGQASIRLHVRAYRGGPVVVAGSRSHAGELLHAFLAKLGEHRLISMGSALKSCLVAEGEADLYPRFGPTSEWDTGAAQCIVEEAGGHVTDTAMQPLRYNTKDSLINPSFFVFGEPDRDWSVYLP
jgi:3'(2'), 5'-bisphosphate nucleotidase